MNGRTYRYFTEQPLYPFGYGLSFSSFTYSDAKITPDQVAAGSAVTVSVRVTNSSSIPGDEVVELYLSHPSIDGAPIKASPIEGMLREAGFGTTPKGVVLWPERRPVLA